MGTKEDLSDFERGVVVSAGQAGLNISTTDLLRFSHIAIWVYREWFKKLNPVSGSCVDEHAFYDVQSRKRMDRLV